MREKVFAFKGYGQFYVYNDRDLNCFDNMGNWNGGMWEVNEKDYIIKSHHENLSDENMTELNAKEFKALILLLKTTEKDFADYLEKCCVLYHGKIENLFN